VDVLEKLSKFSPTIIRFVLAISFILHGIPKLTQSAGVAQFFGKIGVPFPHEMVLFIGVLEVVGGIFLFIGFATQVVTPLLILDMLGAILLAKAGTGFVGGFELETLLLAGALSVFLSGPGGFALQKRKQVHSN
jgi:putative oxidoreductase